MRALSCFPNALITLSHLILTAWIAVEVAEASSSPPRPLNAISYLSTLALEILPRTTSPTSLTKRTLSPDSTILQHSDRLRLTVSAFSDTFHLHLHPNDDLIHPAARISIYSSASGSPVLTEVKPLLRHSVLAYTGHVVHPSYTTARLREDASRLWRPDDAQGNLGWARIIVHHQGDAAASIDPVFEGAFSVNGDVYHIMTFDRYQRTKHAKDPLVDVRMSNNLVVFRDSDLLNDSLPAPLLVSACGHDDLDYNNDQQLNPVLRAPTTVTTSSWWDSPWRVFEEKEQDRIANGSRRHSKRDDVAGGSAGSNFVNSIGSTTGCPKEAKLVYMGVAADCQYTTQHGSVQNATSAILSNWNTASALYKSTFNVSLGVINIEVHDTTCPTTPDPVRPWNVDCGTVTLNDRLSLFSTYRATLGNDGAGLWHLMSGCPTGTEVGVAWLGTLCNQQASPQGASVVSGTAVSTSGRTEWQVVAHEIGHNFGAIHDCQSGCNSTSGCCPLTANSCDAQSKFLMSPVTSAGELNFSPCSIGNICSVMQSSSANNVNTTCLLDPNDGTKTILSLQMCGNGIVEAGEDCDPGTFTNSTCCDAKTCKFTADAKCDPTNDLCCTDSCQIAPSSQVCRPAINGGCDIAETCSGTSAKCPADIFKPNGQSCGSGQSCATGQCTSISQQCANVGISLNLTTECPNKSAKTCQISCQNPQDSSSCVVLQALLIDGSPCGYGGTCSQGNCNAGPLLDTVKAWYLSNLQIAIPVSIVVCIVAILLLLGIFSFVRRTCFDRQKPPMDSGLRGPAQRINSWSLPTAPMGPAQWDSSAPISQRFASSNSRTNRSRLPTVETGPSIPPALRSGPSRRTSAAPPHWVDPSPYNGS